MLPDYEKLGVFYLGHGDGGPFLLRASDLTTHAVIVGMTGSGKTGLAVSLLEEAAIDKIPSIVIDPKGDLANLALTFPSLSEDDLRPWVPEGKTAEDEVSLIHKGLAESHQSKDRIARFREAATVRIFTPGSKSIAPVSIVASLAHRPGEEEEARHERVGAVATSLLSLLGKEADPVRSREHILLCHLLLRAWDEGRDLSLQALVSEIQNPKLERLGVMDLESVFPKSDRVVLALEVNSLLASPHFQAWLEGPALDVGSLLFEKGGKPCVNVFSIAHLSDTERMFFVTLLLGQVIAWMRAQPGTSSLRALLFMDEIFGYFPPVANPPSKGPLLTLLKQARAFGLGVVLATQNPVDLDYKGLGNAGTWLIGRLQTERDRARMMDGLAFASPTADRAAIGELLARLERRMFLAYSARGEPPTLFSSRFALSYLRGPLTKDELKRLVGTSQDTGAVGPTQSHAQAASEHKPIAAPGIEELFLSTPDAGPYFPWVFGGAKVRIADAKVGVDFSRSVLFAAPFEEGPLPIQWEHACFVPERLDTCTTEPESGRGFAELPAVGAQAKPYAAWSKAFSQWLMQNQGLSLLRCARLDLTSSPGEEEGAFRGRISHLLREERDEKAETLRKKYAPKLAALEEKIRKAEQKVAKEEEQKNAAGLDAVLSVGAAFAQAFLGRRSPSGMAAGAKSAIRAAGRRSREGKDVERGQEDLASLRERYAELEDELELAMRGSGAAADAEPEPLETITLKPKRGGVTVEFVGLGWWSRAPSL